MHTDVTRNRFLNGIEKKNRRSISTDRINNYDGIKDSGEHGATILEKRITTVASRMETHRSACYSGLVSRN